MKTILNQETMQVTTTAPWGDTETVSYIDFYARAFAIEHLSHKGTHKHILTGSEWKQVFHLSIRLRILKE